MRRGTRERQAWALLLPPLIIIAAVTGYPLLNTFRLSFTDASLTGRQVATNWVGLENYAYVFTDPDFGAAFWRTLYFTYLKVCVPLLGLIFCRNAGAYAYILKSLKHYPAQRGVADHMRALGLVNVHIHNILGGAMSINYGEKPKAR